MKIVHLIQRYPPAIGGCEQWCQQVSRYLVSQGCSVKILTLRLYHEEEFFEDFPPDPNRPPLGAIDNDNGISVYRYQRTKVHPLLQHFFIQNLLDRKLGIYFYGPHSIRMYLDIPRQIRDADVVHLHGMHYPHNFIGYFWARRLRKKVVMTPHFHPGHPFYERETHYWLLKKCDAVLTVTELEKEHLAKGGVAAEKIFTLGNSIDPREYHPVGLQAYRENISQKYHLGEDEKIVTFLGRRVRYKGIEFLVDAIFRLNQSGRKVRLFMIGPSLKWFDDYYRELDNTRKKNLVDFGIVTHPEKVNLLHLSDVVALPSQYEAFGIVFLEAWACGKPVIGTDQGAMAQIIEGAGVKVAYQDVEGLVGAIQYLLSHSIEAKALVERGKRKLMTSYTTEIIGKQVLEILNILKK